MRYFYPLILFVLFFCDTSYSQTTICTFPSIKSEDIKLGEFSSLKTLELNTKFLRVSKYTAYVAYAQENKNIPDSVKPKVIVVTVNGNSLKDPALLRALNKFTPPFYVVFDEIKVIDLKNNQRTLMSRSFRIL